MLREMFRPKSFQASITVCTPSSLPSDPAAPGGLRVGGGQRRLREGRGGAGDARGGARGEGRGRRGARRTLSARRRGLGECPSARSRCLRRWSRQERAQPLTPGPAIRRRRRRRREEEAWAKGRRAGGWESALASAGRRNARVFPEPVPARTRTSMPAHAGGSARRCTCGREEERAAPKEKPARQRRAWGGEERRRAAPPGGVRGAARGLAPLWARGSRASLRGRRATSAGRG